MPNPYFTFVQNSFPGRIARAEEINTQFTLIEAGFEAIGEFPGGADTQIQFNNGGVLDGSPNLTWDGATFSVNAALSALSATISGSVSATSLTASGAVAAATLASTGNATVGGALAVTGKATSATTVGGDSATTLVTKGYVEAGFAQLSHNHAASAITTGTFADARISQSSVTQHVAAIDHDALLNYDAAEHAVINDAVVATTSLWSSDKIDNAIQAIIGGTFPPPGVNTNVVFNDAGLFGADATFTFNKATDTLSVTTLAVTGKASSAATTGGDTATTLVTKGYLDAGFAATSHTHDAAAVTSGQFNVARIPTLDASKIGSGILLASRGGTGLGSYSVGSFLRAESSTSLAARTPGQVLSDIGAAAVSHTHAATDITTGVFNSARIPNLDAGKITTGTFNTSRIPNLDAGKITTGVFSTARIPNLPSSKITGSFTVSQGGTGQTTLTPGYFLRGNGISAITQTSPSAVLAEIGAAAVSHNHSASAITSGTLSTAVLPVVTVGKGGTGLSGSFAGAYLRGNGIAGYDLKNASEVLADLGAATASHVHSAANITSGTLLVARGGTGLTTITSGSYMVGNGTSAPTLKTAATVKSDLNVLESHVAGGGKVTVSTSAPSGGSNGDIWLKV